MRTFAISDQHDDRWNRFHRLEQGKRDSWPAACRAIYGGTLVGGKVWTNMQRIADEISDAEAEDLVRRYRERNGEITGMWFDESADLDSDAWRKIVKGK